MMRVILYAALRAIAAYFLLLVLVRFQGRKQVSQMTFFDFVSGIILGTSGATIAIGASNTILTASVTTIVISLLAIATSILYIKNLSARKLANSEPVVLVQNGSIVEANMKNIRLSINDLMAKLREKNVFNMADVEFAMMESDGEVSVLPKADKVPLTPSDMHIQTTSKGLTKDIIIDGNVLEENLSDAQLNRQWLMEQLNSQGIKDVSEVFYAGVDNSKTLYVSKRTVNKEKDGMYGIE